MKCPNCNSKNEQGAQFCHVCGTRLVEPIRPVEILEGQVITPRWKERNPFGTPPHGVEAINLGLPSGIRWASCNVRATRPEEYGGLFGWGETEVRTSSDWGTYTRCGGNENTCYDLGRNIAGTKYDVARVEWGGQWQIPSKKQVDELRDNCSFEWTTLQGVEGGRLTGPNGNSIFLPRLPQQRGNNYWLSEPEGTFSALSFSIGRDGVFSYREVIYSRCCLMHIRPVVFL